MRVSVIMPSLNQAAFIEQAATSVLNQDWPDLELIVMDGGSTDSTCAHLAALHDRYGERLVWRSELDNGPAEAINKALDLATGDIIGWLNADDLYLEGAIERAVKKLEQNPDQLMVYGQAKHIDAHGRILGDYPTRLPSAGIDAFAAGCFICQPTVFLRKHAVETIGHLNTDLKASFDLDYWLRIFHHSSEAIGFVNQGQAYSRLHSDCITLKQRETVILESMSVVAKALGQSPMHWFTTYANEIIVQNETGENPEDVLEKIRRFSKQASLYVSAQDRQRIQKQIETLFPKRIAQHLSRRQEQIHRPPEPTRPALRTRLNLRKSVGEIRASGLFDQDWYLASYPDVADAQIDPVMHFLYQGAAEGRNPSPDFDTDFYLSAHPDIAVAGINPLLHYLRYGKSEGRITAPAPARSSSAKRLVMHVGTDKTGSTAIQTFLAENAGSLSEIGLYYPRTGRPGPHHGLLYDAVTNNDSALWQQLAQEAAENPNLTSIVSFEGLYHLETEKLKDIRKALSHFDIHIVIYLRRQSDKVRSGIAQTFKPGTNLPIASYTTKTLLGMAQNYEPILDRLVKVFGRRKVRVRRYEKSQLFRGNLILDFLQTVGASGPIDHEDARFVWSKKDPNPSLDVECLHILEHFDQVSIPAKQRTLVKSILLESSSGEKTSFVSNTDAEAIDKRFDRQNKRIAQAFFKEKTLFRDPAVFSYRALDPKRLEKYADLAWAILPLLTLPHWNGERTTLEKLQGRRNVHFRLVGENVGSAEAIAVTEIGFRMVGPKSRRLELHGDFGKLTVSSVTILGKEHPVCANESSIEIELPSRSIKLTGGVILVRIHHTPSDLLGKVCEIACDAQM